MFFDEKSFNLRKNKEEFPSFFKGNSMAFSLRDFSFMGRFDYKNELSVISEIGYSWDSSINFSIYANNVKTNCFYLKNLYTSFSLFSESYRFWFGIRTIELEPLNILNVSNPLDQIGLQGFGLDSKNIELGLSLNQSKVSSVGYSSASLNSNAVLELDSTGSPVYYSTKEYVASAYILGRLLLKEGRLFEPLLAFRYYYGASLDNSNKSGISVSNVNYSSAVIVGGVFSRPLSYGIAGKTTLWFSSMPSNDLVISDVSKINLADGFEREPYGTPRNVIGIMDNSEFYLVKNGLILTSFFITNNTYSKKLPVLHINQDRSNLNSSNNEFMSTNNLFSSAIEPQIFLNHFLILGTTFQINYVSEKLHYNDANSYMISPFLKYALDQKLKSNKYLFLSATFGQYDWKIIHYSDGTNSDKILSFQFGAKVEI
jgi:hypothetical protein